MDLKKEIMDFLQTKKDWDLIAKTYYIYIKLCKTFSYDYRYLFGTEEEKKEIYHKEMNECNIEEWEIVCLSWCKLAQKILLELKINSEICFDVLPHVYLIAHIPPYQIKMDPMKDGYDLTRVKIGSRTHGFKDLNNNFDFSSKLQVLAKEIDSNGSYFADECINMLSTELKNNNMYQDPRYSKFSNEILHQKMNLIYNLVNNNNLVKKYYYIDRYFDYLNLKLMSKWEQSKIHKHPFWIKENDKWDVLDLILLEQEEDKAICYKLAENNGKFVLSKIDFQEMNYYLDFYNGEVKGLYRSLTF